MLECLLLDDVLLDGRQIIIDVQNVLNVKCHLRGKILVINVDGLFIAIVSDQLSFVHFQV